MESLPHYRKKVSKKQVKLTLEQSRFELHGSTSMCAKSLQLCPTLCDPVDCSPPGSSVHGDSPDKNTGMGGHALFQGNLPDPGIKPASLASPALAGGFFSTRITWVTLAKVTQISSVKQVTFHDQCIEDP